MAIHYEQRMKNYPRNSEIEKYRRALIGMAYGRVLETGIGTSMNLMIYDPNVKVVGIDWSESMLRVAERKPTILDIKYIQEDVERMGFKDNTFDCVVDTFGMEYYLNPKKALSEMKRVTKKDGKILILASGAMKKSFFWDYFLDFKKATALETMGYFAFRNWDEIITDSEFEIESKLKVMNDSVYLFVLKNSKKE